MKPSDVPVLTQSACTSAHAMEAWMTAAADTGAVALIDKEEDWTSFDVVAKLRSATRIRRIGHAGTLDPLATGLLIVCLGKATKRVEEFQEEQKTYAVTIRLGATTETDDRGSVEVPVQGAEAVGDLEVQAALQHFVGTIQQVPPTYAAIKHQGRPQYSLARAGASFVPRPRIVTIDSIEDVSYTWPDVSCTVVCSKGTYIRSLARDVGALLGVGGYVHQLRRTRSGGFSVDDAVTIGMATEAIRRTRVAMEAA